MKDIIEQVRTVRDQKIDRLVNDRQTLEHLLAKCGITKLTSIQEEFVRRELISLRESKLDLVHYSTLIIGAKVSRNIDSISFNNVLFEKELITVLKRYHT